MKHLDKLLFPKFLNRKGEPMPNTGNWQQRHLDGVYCLQSSVEYPLISMIRGWLEYADMNRDRYESSIGDDYVLGPEWRAIGVALRGLLIGGTGRLDCGTLDAIILDTMAEEGLLEVE